MENRAKLIISTLFSFILTTTPVMAEDNKPKLNEESYSLGINIGTQLKKNFDKQDLSVEPESFLKGLGDVLSGNSYQLSNIEIQEALHRLQKRINIKSLDKIKKQANKHYKELIQEKDIPFLGNPDGDILLVMFFDYQCPYCKQMHTIIEKLIESNKNIKVLLRELPILGPNSKKASELALSIQDHKQYLSFHRALLNTKSPLSPSTLQDIVTKQKLSLKELETGKNVLKAKKLIQENLSFASKLGLKTTPSLFITRAEDPKKPVTPLVIYVPGKTGLTELEAFIKKLPKQAADA